jgi:nucleotide-binding universal stress UspA family protein
MGTRGLGRLPGFVLGSTAMRVVQLADVPVTLVK